MPRLRKSRTTPHKAGARLARAKPRAAVKQLGEIGLIERIIARFTSGVRAGKSVVVGPGDDAAVLDLGGRSRLVLTTDMLVEGVHFRLEWSYPEAVGFKSVVANLSDIAAMGATPVGIVVCLGVPPTLPVSAVDGLYRGMTRALSLFGGELLGGDTVRADAITLGVSAIGMLASSSPTLRSGARPGDKVCVTGALGGSQAGLLLLDKYFGSAENRRGERRIRSFRGWVKREADDFRRKLPASIRGNGFLCILRHLTPVPRVREAGIIAGFKPSSMIDISDGLAADVFQIARASGVGFRILEDALPVSGSVRSIAQFLGTSPGALALASGEEYEILLTIRPERLSRLARTLPKHSSIALTVIGEVTEARERVLLAGRRGNPRTLSELGYRHF
ncbi:MAG: thiamine-monophosphate kinase [Candidatus Eisenbacteria bacterium]